MVKSEDTRGLEYYLRHNVHLEVRLLYATLNLTIFKSWKSKYRCIHFGQQRQTVVTKNFDSWHGGTRLQSLRCFEPSISFYGNGGISQKSGGSSNCVSRDMSRTVAEKDAGGSLFDYCLFMLARSSHMEHQGPSFDALTQLRFLRGKANVHNINIEQPPIVQHRMPETSH